MTATRRDLIVMSQSCDLAIGQEKVQEVLLSQVWKRSQVANIRPFNKPGAFSQVAKGQNYGFHLLRASTAPGYECELRIVDFGRVYSLPLVYARRFVAGPQYLRLLPLTANIFHRPLPASSCVSVCRNQYLQSNCRGSGFILYR